MKNYSVQVEGYYDRISLLKEISTSTDLATFFGEAIKNSDYGVTIMSDGNLHYSPDGTAADADNAKLPTVYSINGKQQLDSARFFSASGQDVSIILYSKLT